MTDFISGLLVGLFICLVHSIMWGVWTYRDRGEWEREQEQRDICWQSKIADIVLDNYVRHVKRGE